MGRFQKYADREKKKLQRQIRQVGTPYWALKKGGSTLLKTAVALYAINAGVQSYNMAHSESFQARYDLAQNGIEVFENLSDDQTFNTAIHAYIEAKALLDPAFGQNWNTLRDNLSRVESSNEEFQHNLERIYNPLWFF